MMNRDVTVVMVYGRKLYRRMVRREVGTAMTRFMADVSVAAQTLREDYLADQDAKEKKRRRMKW